MSELLLFGQVLLELTARLLVYLVVIIVAAILGILLSGVVAFCVALGW